MTARSVALAATLVLLVPVAAGAQAQPTPEQRMVDMQIATPKLASGAAVTLDLQNTALRDVIASVVTAGGVTVRYHSGVTNLDTATTAKFSNSTIEDALQTVLQSRGLTYKVTGSKSVFIYPNTPENRQKYTETVRTFSVVNANVSTLGQVLNQALTPVGPDELPPVIVSTSESRTFTVRATADMMARVAKLIADNDKR